MFRELVRNARHTSLRVWLRSHVHPFLTTALLSATLISPAFAALTIQPITWNVVGLDSNSPSTGPFRFPVGARVCAVGAPSNGTVSAAFAFQPGGTNNGATGCTGGVACITLRSATLSSYALTTGALAAGSCADAYFEVEVFNQDGSAFNRARNYTITATDGSGSVSTPQPRELYVERIISQNRNSVLDVSYSSAKLLSDPFPTPVGPGLTSVAAGGSFGLAVGGIYDIRLDATTATQGYEQLETFANFSNAVFRILRVQSTYSANTSPFYPAPPNTITDVLYANGCDWQLSPVLPNYLGCQGIGKTGGTISATYRIQVLAVPTGTATALNTLVYDYSGSSFHYNSDTGTGGRTIYVEDPASATISKSFGPSTITSGGTSTLTFTITNPNRFTAVTLASFTDILPTSPGQMSVANPQNVTYTGCGPGVFSPNPPAAGATSLSFSGATIQPQSDCVITVDVTATAQGTYNNTSSFLAINGVPTTSQASASLVVGPVSSPPICATGAPQIEIARWNFSALSPPAAPTHPFAPSFIASGVSVSTNFTARTANAGPPIYGAGAQSSSTIGNPSPSWAATGWPATDAELGATLPAQTTSSLLEFNVNTTAYSNIAITLDGMALSTGDWANPSDNNGRFYHRFNGTGAFVASTGGLQNFNKSNSASFLARTWTTIGVGNVNFRFAIAGANKDAAVFLTDNVVITGCNQFIAQPTLSKSFASDPIVVGTNSRLSFVINNTANASTALTGVTFTDALPTGLQVAPVPNASFSPNCVGAAFTGLAAGATTLTFNGGVTAGGTCTAEVDIRGTSAGLKSNVTSAIFSNETQTNTGPTGYGEDTILVYADSLSKSFSPSPIVTNGISKLSFVVTNPSATSPITSVGFVDNFPPGVVVAPTPNLTRSPASCGTVGVNWNNTGAAQVTLSGVTVAAASSCTYTVDVTSAAALTYNNLSNPLTFQVNGTGPVITGDTAAATLVVNAPVSAIGLRKQIATTNTPSTVWSNFVSIAPSTPVFYKFTVENLGTAVLTRPGSGFWVTDGLIPGGPFCNTPATLPVAVPGNDNHIFECIVGPVPTPGSATTLTNSATASSTTVSSAVATATYTSKLPDLLVNKTRIAPVGTLNTETTSSVTYRITVTNQAPAATVNSTLAPIIVEDTLRSGITYTSFSSSDPFWSCSLVQTAPLHKVSCTYSGVLAPSPGAGSSTSFDLTVQVAAGTPDINNVAVAQNGGDPECNQSAETPITQCKSRVEESSLNDYGDLPDAAAGVGPSAGGAAPNYRTTLADGGPIAKIVSGLSLGATIDADLNGVNSAGIADDTADGSDDEEGLESFTRLLANNSNQVVTGNVRVTNTTGSAARICLFVDRNADGTFDDPGEIGTVAVPNGTNNALLAVTIPAPGVSPSTPPGTPGIGIRVRLALEADIGATCEFAEADGFLTGSNANPAVGEVEDYYTATPGTVPVTLSRVDVREVGGELLVNFNTASEAGTLGYRVLADIGKGVQARIEIGSVASKAVDSLKEQSYSVRARNPGAEQIWIEETSIVGKTELYGPYQVGAAVGELGLAQALNWSLINQEQAAFRANATEMLRRASPKAAEVRVSESSWVELSYETLLAAGIDFSGELSRNIVVRRGSETVPATVSGRNFGAGERISFYAQAVDNSLYTKTAVYRIELGRGLVVPEMDARPEAGSTEILDLAGTRVLDSNTAYSFSSPLEDPWYSFRALRSGTSVGVGSISFTLKDRVDQAIRSERAQGISNESLEVSFWGGLDYSGENPDHHAQFKLNGVLLGETRFDGFGARTERFTVPNGVLVTGTNTLTVELPNSTGYAADIVNVESVVVAYTQRLIAQGDRLNVQLPATAPSNNINEDGTKATSTFVVTGLSGQGVTALLKRAGSYIVLGTDPIVSGSLRLQLAAREGDQLVITPIKRDLTVSPAAELADPISGEAASYLIISHPSFVSGLNPFVLAKQLQGFSVKVVDVEAIYRYYSAGVVDPAAIQLAIQKAKDKLGTTHVLLVGGDTYDYQNILGINSVSFIPTNYRRTGPIIAFAPSDAVYADTDGDDRPNVALGRWPVRTMAELNAIVAKSLNYRSSHKALFVSDRSLNGVSYANEVGPLSNLLGSKWSKQLLSLDSYPSGQAANARADIVSQLQTGTSLLSYYGHSAPASWSREGLITANQVNGGLFDGVTQSFAGLQLGCWGTYFVEPSSTTVAHAMLLRPSGAALMLGASALTEATSDVALANGLLPRLSSESFGEALMHTLDSIGTNQPIARDVILGGTLLGDPSLR